MKYLILSALLYCSIPGVGQNAFTLTEANESKEVIDIGSSYNDGIIITKKVLDGNKYILLEGTIKEGLEIEIEKENIFFTSGDIKVFPAGKLGFTGNVELTSVYDLNTKYSRKFSYVFIVNESIKSGTLCLGDYKVPVNSIGTDWPASDEPRSIEVVKSELIDKYVGQDEVDDTEDKEYKIEVTYKPVTGKFLVVTIEVVSPLSKSGKKERGKNFTFHPSQFILKSQTNGMSECVAFLRDGYDNEFSESMNNGVLYDSPDKRTLRIVFPVGEEGGKYTIVHNGKLYGSFEVK